MINYYHSSARARNLELIDKPKTGSWVHVVEPTDIELDQLAKDHNIDRDLLNDAIDIYEAPRLEVNDKNTYVFTRYCYPAGKEVATEPLLIIYTSDNIITILRRGSNVLDKLLSGKTDILTTQKTKVLLRILEQINRSYLIQLGQTGKRILKIRGQVRRNEITNAEFVNMIDLEEDLNEFLTALHPQAGVLTSLRTGRYIKLYDEDQEIMEDLTLGTSEIIELSRSRLRALVNFRQAYDTIVTKNLNTAFKRLTSIGIFLTIPMIAGGLWGMNVLLPLSDDENAFWVIVGGTIAATLIFILSFRKRGWI